MRCLEDFDAGKMKISGCDRLFQWKIANMGYLYLRNIKAMCQGKTLYFVKFDRQITTLIIIFSLKTTFLRDTNTRFVLDGGWVLHFGIFEI